MGTLGPTESMSLIEFVILGFMAANVALTGGFVIQRGLQRLAMDKSE